jgi:hypothetical protein
MIALVICAKSPSKIGAVVWQDHPTLRALMKMITTNRFKFPTVDCDEPERNEMKRLDYAAREEVGELALDYLPVRNENTPHSFKFDIAGATNSGTFVFTARTGPSKR